MSDRELEEAVKGFFLRRPDLSLECFGLPAERLTWLVPFRAIDATAMLLRRWPRREQGWHTVSYLMRQSGDVALASAPHQTIIPSRSIAYEIGLSLWESPWESYVPLKPGSTKRVLPEWQAFRRAWSDSQGDTIARLLIEWSFAAVSAVPGLMYGYRAHATASPDVLRLEPFARSEPVENARKAEPWRL